MKKIIFALLVGACVAQGCSSSSEEGDKGAGYIPSSVTLVPFEDYTPREGYPKVEINPVLVENCSNKLDLYLDGGAAANGVSNDSAVMQAMIDRLAQNDKGGVLYVPKSTYVLSGITLKSNVHIHIAAGTVIKLPANEENPGLFRIGLDGYIENVVIRGIGGRYSVDVADRTDRVRIFVLNSVHHFMISDVNIYDNKTSFPIITMGVDNNNDPEIFGPTNGVIKNASAYNSHYGYGLVQAQAARKVYFENLYGEGGATLRFETGEDVMNIAQFGGVFDVVARNITNVNGNTAVMISPHAMHCGVVQVEGVVAQSSGFAARIDEGYVEVGLPSTLTPGTYAEGSYVAGVKGTFGVNAQVKGKHFVFMPTELIPTGDPTGRNGLYEPCASVACVLAKDLNYPIGIYDVEASGYSVDDIVTEYYK